MPASSSGDRRSRFFGFFVGLGVRDAVSVLVQFVDQQAASAGVGVQFRGGDQDRRIANQARSRFGCDPLASGLVIVGDQRRLDLVLDHLGEIAVLDSLVFQVLDDGLAFLVATEVLSEACAALLIWSGVVSIVFVLAAIPTQTRKTIEAIATPAFSP